MTEMAGGSMGHGGNLARTAAEQADRLVARITIRGSIEAVWRELTKNDEPQAAVFNAWLHAQSFLPGARLQMRTANGKNVMVIGDIVDFDPPRRFAHTFRFTMYDDAPCTVIYDLKPVPGGVEVSLTVENLPVGTRTAKQMQLGSKLITMRLKAVVETGRPGLGTRIVYLLLGRLGFVLPKRTRVEHWPL
jgi:uncharacterized protein YndB with AHSA1/START domain